MPEPRMEMTPLLDVVFLLLTFFIFSMVLMVRAEFLNISLPGITSGEPAKAQQTITIALSAQGQVQLNGKPIVIDELVDAVKALQEELGTQTIWIAADESSRTGDFAHIASVLASGGIDKIALLGQIESVETEAP